MDCLSLSYAVMRIGGFDDVEEDEVGRDGGADEGEQRFNDECLSLVVTGELRIVVILQQDSSTSRV